MEFFLVSSQPCRAGGNPAHKGDRLERAIVSHFKAENRSIAIGQVVEESAVVALGHGNRVTAIASDSRPPVRIECRQTSIMCDTEAGNGAAPRIGSVNKSAIMSGDQPAGGLLRSWHGSANHCEVSILRKRVRRCRTSAGFGNEDPVFTTQVESKRRSARGLESFVGSS